MGILNKLLNKKNKFVQPKIIIENGSKAESTLLIEQSYEKDRTYQSTWFADPQSKTGRKYRVQVTGEYGQSEATAETLALAVFRANKNYDKKVK